ncbi:DNA topoisomerase III [Oceanisphaera pacifica]|uniref:DNA topoisomerase 3 n=1 Tax=Oceanisphaera pacifica TaxID=2818389 RepID=A0ABS3NFQ6_9GAMM|nr:DNA topoisomerase III [Oceanisphaera pacifica]MBO1519228.1 DNA topoisomerase III [Oceanisphaera pacifica]
MILYIAEKPSVGRAVADVLPKPQKKGEGFITAANGDVVTWCIGHLLEQAEPQAYNPDFKKWRKEHLPIVPEVWQHTVKSATKKQFTVVKKLVKQADVLVNMGDPDRVGQILVDEVINYCQVPKAKRAAAQRCLINDMNPEAIQRALNNLRPNRDFIPLATSALARARADWLYGINMTRLCTLQGQASGYQGVLSVGRVQTPILGLVVHRDLEIENFVSKPFYEVFIELKTANNDTYTAKWKPSAACEPYMDEDGRVLLKKLADTVLSKVVGQTGQVMAVTESLKKQAPPLPYNLSVLQIDAAKRFNLTAQKTLDICQQLYERHKLVTYPRSDCRYLPNEHYQDKSAVVQGISKTCGTLAEAVSHADLSLKSKAWNDAKVGAHHAIIPTRRGLDSSRLSQDELKIYELVARQYLMQFYPAFQYQEKQIDTQVAGGLFISRQKEVVHQGWKALFPDRGAKNKSAGEDAEFSAIKLPNVSKGESVTCIDGRLDEKQTSPPRHFTDATLLSAMTGIARYVNDPEIKKVLRDTDGLGTEATRAGIIELLFKRDFLIKKGKEIHATEVGRRLILSLPEIMTLPDMTAHWESQLEAIADKRMSYGQFMNPMLDGLAQLVHQVSDIAFSGLKGHGKPFRKKRKPRATSSPRRRASSSTK